MINWQNISDDELDGLFRDAAESHEVEYDPASWQKMTEKLDTLKPSKNTSSIWIRRGLLLLALLFVSTVGWIVLRISDSKDSDSYSKDSDSYSKDSDSYSKDADSKDSDSKPSDSENVNSNNSNSKENKDLVNVSGSNSTDEIKKTQSFDSKNLDSESNINPPKESNSIERNIVNSNNSKPKSQSLVSKNSYKKINDKSKNSYNTKLSYISSNELDNSESEFANKNSNKIVQLLQNQLFINKSESIDNSEQTNYSVQNDISVNIENSEINKLFSKNITYLKSHPFNLKTIHNLPSIVFEDDSKPTQTTQSSDMFKRGLYLRPLLSPDLSVVVGNPIGQIGSNWGLLLDYRFNKSLSIQAGVIRSTKLYDAYPDQYTFAWKMPLNNPLKEIEATCKMLDIPLNIRYDLTKEQNTRWFVSTGITSYAMLNEKYDYFYENNNDPSIKWRKWEGNTGKYLFSVANFSMGYESRIARRLTIQAEPFVKIPLGKIGFGNVRLLSAGLFVSAKYPLIRF